MAQTYADLLKDPRWQRNLPDDDPTPIGVEIVKYLSSKVDISSEDFTKGVNYTYFIQSGVNGPVKIGKAWNPFLRMRQLQTGNPSKLKLLLVIKDPLEKWEKRLQSIFEKYHIRGEWYKGSNEIYSMIAKLKKGDVNG